MNIKHFSVLASGVAVGMLTAAPVYSADLQVVDLNVQPADNGVQVSLEMDGETSTAPQIFTISRNNQTITDVLNAQLNLGDRQKLTQLNPMPGIESIEILQLDSESVRIVATGITTAPSSKIVSRDDERYVFKFAPGTEASATSNNLLAQTPTNSETVPTVQSEPEVIFPSPQIPNEGKPTPTSAENFLRPTAPAPPFLPRASAPPVGDIAVSTTNSMASNYIDLGTAAVVPRLVLKDAPAQDVLALLARSAEMNLVLAEDLSDKSITLDLENEPVQDVFNYVLMLSDLKAAMRGRTIFVGNELPSAVLPSVTRTFRLNQASAEEVKCFLTTGDSTVSETITEKRSNITSGQEAGEEAVTLSSGQETETETSREITRTCVGAENASARQTGTSGEENLVQQEGLMDLFSRLHILTDARLNSVTLSGEPSVVEIASSFITQLDARKRQVAVNVKILEVALEGSRSISSDIQLLLEDRVGISAGNGIILSPQDLTKLSGSPFGDFSTSNFIIEQGSQIVNLGQTLDVADLPNTDTERTDSVFQEGNLVRATVSLFDDEGNFSGTTTRTLGQLVNPLGEGTNFIGSLVASLMKNTTSKIVADPTLIIQENESSELRITEEIISNLDRTEERENENTTISVTAEKDEVGLIVPVSVENIDDNGFVTLNISAEVSVPSDTIDFTFDGNGTEITLKRKSLLNSGRVRLRDDQTLVLAGIVDERDIVETLKVPILGDIPILGSLFRTTNRNNSRRELLFIITPQILDDSQNATWGYDYIPSDTAQEMLRSERFSTQER